MYKLPSWTESYQQMQMKEDSFERVLARFIYFSEPAGIRNKEIFRQGLEDVVDRLTK